jgi:hypothetical protein
MRSCKNVGIETFSSLFPPQLTPSASIAEIQIKCGILTCEIRI